MKKSRRLSRRTLLLQRVRAKMGRSVKIIPTTREGQLAWYWGTLHSVARYT